MITDKNSHTKTYDLIYISHFFYPRPGGLEKAVYELLSYLARKGHRCLSVHGADKRSLFSLNSFDCISFNPIKIFNGAYPIFGIRFASELFTIIRSNPQASILIGSRHLTSSLISAILCTILRHPYILVEHTAAPSLFSSPLTTKLSWLSDKYIFRYVVDHASSIVSVSEGSRQFLVSQFAVPSKKIQVIHNGFTPSDIDSFSPKNKENIVLYTSRWIPIKNPEATFYAFRNIAAHYPDWTFLLYSEYVPQTLMNLKCPPNFRLFPHRLGLQKDIYNLLRKTKIYVNSSLSEGLSLNIVEACGLGNIPVISDAPSNREIAQKVGTAEYVFKREDPKDLLEKIEQAIHDSSLATLPNDISQRAHFHFSNEKLFAQYEHVLFSQDTMENLPR